MQAGWADKLGDAIKGEVYQDRETLLKYSHDASIFEINPQVVAVPKNVHDIERLVQFVNLNKKDDPGLSLTARSAGTDMSGGPLNDSIIVDFQKNINK